MGICRNRRTNIGRPPLLNQYSFFKKRVLKNGIILRVLSKANSFSAWIVTSLVKWISLTLLAVHQHLHSAPQKLRYGKGCSFSLISLSRIPSLPDDVVSFICYHQGTPSRSKAWTYRRGLELILSIFKGEDSRKKVCLLIFQKILLKLSILRYRFKIRANNFPVSLVRLILCFDVP